MSALRLRTLEPTALALCVQAIQCAVHFPVSAEAVLPPVATFRLECWCVHALSVVDAPVTRTQQHGVITSGPTSADAGPFRDGLRVLRSYLRMTNGQLPDVRLTLRRNLQHAAEYAASDFLRFSECASGRALQQAHEAGVTGRFVASLRIAWDEATLSERQAMMDKARRLWAPLRADANVELTALKASTSSKRRVDAVGALGAALQANNPMEAYRAALEATSPPHLPPEVTADTATGNSPVRRARANHTAGGGTDGGGETEGGNAGGGTSPGRRGGGAADATEGRDGASTGDAARFVRRPETVIHVHGALASCRHGLAQAAFGDADGALAGADAALQHAHQGQHTDVLAASHLARASAHLHAGRAQACTEDLGIALRLCHTKRSVACPPPPIGRVARALLRVEAAALLCAAEVFLHYGGGLSDTLVARLAAGINTGAEYYVAARPGSSTFHKQAPVTPSAGGSQRAPGDSGSGGGGPPGIASSPTPGRAPSLLHYVQAALAAASVIAAQLGASAPAMRDATLDVVLTQRTIALLQHEAQRLSLVPGPPPTTAATIASLGSGHASVPPALSAIDCTVAACAAVRWVREDPRALARSMDLLSHVVRDVAPRSLAAERAAVDLARAVVCSQGLLDGGWWRHAHATAARAQEQCVERLSSLGSVAAGLVVESTRILADALVALGRYDAVEGACIDTLVRAVLRPPPPPQLPSVTHEMGDAATSSQGPAGDGRSSGHIDAALRVYIIQAQLACATGRLTEAAQLFTQVVGEADELCSYRAAREAAVALVPLAVATNPPGRRSAADRLRAACVAVQPSRLSVRAAMDFLTAQIIALGRGFAVHDVAPVRIRDAGPGCAAAGLALAPGGGRLADAEGVPLKVAIAFAAAGKQLNELSDTGGEEGGPSAESSAPYLLGRCVASAREHARGLPGLLRTAKARAVGTEAPPAALFDVKPFVQGSAL